MVLADLGRRINAAFSELSRVPVVDDAAVDALLKQVCSALLESDVNVKLVQGLRDDVRGTVREQLNADGKEKLAENQRRNLVQKVSARCSAQGQDEWQKDVGAVERTDAAQALMLEAARV